MLSVSIACGWFFQRILYNSSPEFMQLDQFQWNTRKANMQISVCLCIFLYTYNISTYSYLKHVNHFGQYPKRSERIQFPLKRNRFFYTNYTLQKNYNIWHIYFKDRTGTGWDISGKRRKCRRYSCSKARSRYVKTFVAYI